MTEAEVTETESDAYTMKVIQKIPKDIMNDLIYLVDDLIAVKTQYRQILSLMENAMLLKAALGKTLTQSGVESAEKIKIMQTLLMNRDLPGSGVYREGAVFLPSLSEDQTKTFRRMLHLDTKMIYSMTSIISTEIAQNRDTIQKVVDVMKNKELDETEKIAECINALI